MEAVAQEVAPFGITCLPAELGPTRTQFGVNAEWADPHAAHDETPVEDMRRRLDAGAWTFADLAKVTDALVAAGGDSNAPLRLALGSTAHASVTTVLRGRLTMLEPQAASAAALDATEQAGAERAAQPVVCVAALDTRLRAAEAQRAAARTTVHGNVRPVTR